jgi:hypothetical protein
VIWTSPTVIDGWKASPSWIQHSLIGSRRRSRLDSPGATCCMRSLAPARWGCSSRVMSKPTTRSRRARRSQASRRKRVSRRRRSTTPCMRWRRRFLRSRPAVAAAADSCHSAVRRRPLPQAGIARRLMTFAAPLRKVVVPVHRSTRSAVRQRHRIPTGFVPDPIGSAAPLPKAVAPVRLISRSAAPPQPKTPWASAVVAARKGRRAALKPLTAQEDSCAMGMDAALRTRLRRHPVPGKSNPRAHGLPVKERIRRGAVLCPDAKRHRPARRVGDPLLRACRPPPD